MRNVSRLKNRRTSGNSSITLFRTRDARNNDNFLSVRGRIYGNRFTTVVLRDNLTRVILILVTRVLGNTTLKRKRISMFLIVMLRPKLHDKHVRQFALFDDREVGSSFLSSSFCYRGPATSREE